MSSYSTHGADGGTLIFITSSVIQLKDLSVVRKFLNLALFFSHIREPQTCIGAIRRRRCAEGSSPGRVSFMHCVPAPSYTFPNSLSPVTSCSCRLLQMPSGRCLSSLVGSCSPWVNQERDKRPAKIIEYNINRKWHFFFNPWCGLFKIS